MSPDHPSAGTSAAAAARHQELLAAGPSRSGRTYLLTAALLAPAAVAAALPLPVLSVLLGCVSAALVWVVVDDRRQAWRFRPDPAGPGVVVPPAAVAPAEPDLVIDLTDRFPQMRTAGDAVEAPASARSGPSAGATGD